MAFNFFKKLLRKNDRFIWEDFAKQNNGTFIKGQYGTQDAVEISYKKFRILFDSHILYRTVGNSTFETEFTRIRIEFCSPDNLRFRLLPQGIIDTIGKLFGAQDIRIGDKKFDARFMIQGNDNYKIQTIFSNDFIKEVLLTHNDVSLRIIDQEGIFEEEIQEGNCLLYYLSEDKVTTIEQLDLLKKLMIALIGELTNVSSMQPLNPRN